MKESYENQELIVPEGNDEFLSIQWFPGHMAKTRRKLKESLPMVDVVAEICDARIPLASRNPELAEITGGKPRIVLLNKSDMADVRATRQWQRVIEQNGDKPLVIDCKTGKGLNAFGAAAASLMKEKLDRLSQRGVKHRAVRVMVVGIPNVGKSTFINKLCGSSAKVENRPGVTRNNQWYRSKDGAVEFLDTPGVLWPKFEDKAVGEHLAFTGAVRDAILDSEMLATRLLDCIMKLNKGYEKLFAARYKLSEEQLGFYPAELLHAIGRNRGMIIRGGDVDIERASNMLLEEFKNIKIGPITLEWAEDHA